MKNLKFLLIIFVLTPFLSVAQKNIGYEFFMIGDYELAKKYYEQQIGSIPAEANFYLGEMAFSEGKLEQAKSYYTKGLTANPNDPFNAIGLAKLENKGSKKNAETALEAIQEKYYKDFDVTLTLGYAYLSINLPELALKKVESAIQLDKSKKSPKPFLLHGDILNAEKNYGGATGKYDMAIYFDTNFAISYIKEALIYEHSNIDIAIEKLKEIALRQPDYLITYRYLGKFYTDGRYYGLASEAYKKYFALNYYTFNDLTQYITALYFNKEYNDAKAMMQEGLKKEPNNFVLNRLLMYTDANLHSSEGLNSAKKFFAIPKETRSYLASDYSMYALILKDAKMYDEAMVQYKKAIEIDSSAAELYKEIAILLGDKGENEAAANYHITYIEKTGRGAGLLDYYQIGRYYYGAGHIASATDSARILSLQKNTDFINKIAATNLQKDSLAKDKVLFLKQTSKYYLDKANLYFDSLINGNPDGQSGYLWKARTNSLLDPSSEIGLAKPYYEKVIEILTAKNDTTNKTLLEAYNYLAFYYYVKNDKDNIILYWSKVLELDPNNENAIKVLKSFKR